MSVLDFGCLSWLTERRIKIINSPEREASRDAGAQSVTVEPTGCGFDPHSRR